MGDPKLQPKGAVERLRSNTPTLGGTGLREVEEQYHDDDAGSHYGDSEGDEAEGTKTEPQSIFQPEPIDDLHPHNLCSPGSYAEFMENPYSHLDSVTLDAPLDSVPNGNQESGRDCLSLSRSGSQKGGANVREACQRFIQPRAENMDEALERLSSNLSSAYNAIKTEESASLQFLQKFCA
ncbi:hypothetical protein F5Y13DRAFT_173753 [Hypoxylon sp. FL1857]|nr:hypothetical protein F5Y13DRAFT_173753 [Hypoxylon sp. FL1857]